MTAVAGAVVAAAAWTGVTASPAFAEDPVSFGASPVVDTAGVLGGDLADVEQAIDEAAERSGRQLFVAYVPTFTNPESAVEWAADTAIANNLGDEDYLLAVAVDGRAYYLSAANEASLSADEVQRISLEVVEPELVDEDWAGAAIAAADAIAGGGSGGGPGWGFIWFLVIAGVIVVGVVLLLAWRKRRRNAGAGAGTGGAGAPAPEVPLDELRRQAGGALVGADDAIRTSEEELGFAVASYGEEATAPFREALAAAKAKVAEAFGLQQRLDDAEPDTDAQRREWYGGILRLTGEADAALDEQAARFDELRDLERNAPQELERVRRAASQAAAHVAPASQRLDALRAQYADSALAAVADNPAQAESRLGFARAAIDEASAALGAGRAGEAAVAIRAGEEAVDQATALSGAIERLAGDLAAADQAVAAGVADLDRDVAEAGANPEGGLAELARSTAAEAAAIRDGLAQPRRDPLALHARVERANAAIDAAIGSVRAAAEQAARVAAQLDRSLVTARAQVQAAEDYLVARRGAIGAEARTRLAEAGRHLALAEQARGTDPAAALGDAQRAETLAAEAMRLAQQDVGGFGGLGGPAAGPGGQGGWGAPTGGGGGGDLFGAVLGGILINSVLGGGGGGGGFGGGFSGGGGGRSRAGFGGSFGGGRSAGSFGGGGTRGRRGSGGRF
ncbi:hypothetical protein GE115_17870 [Agromyces sp. CFH 90414]|uniref:TPM domain-containing protein n=1 Tax=Agromyces agglutinans TaxID=2662258 RepID=A0A6I2FAS3_9MICO|nr:TPM domain-containing protein [Agromyces agglutinans]MRG61729.1 hypothetical protein [Agromyces agglutinans]